MEGSQVTGDDENLSSFPSFPAGQGQHIPISHLFPVWGSAVTGLKACDLSTTGWSSRTASHNKTLFPISWASLLFCHSNTWRVCYHSEEGVKYLLQHATALWCLSEMLLLLTQKLHGNLVWQSMFNTVCKARFWNSILFCFNIFYNLCLHCLKL